MLASLGNIVRVAFAGCSVCVPRLSQPILRRRGKDYKTLETFLEFLNRFSYVKDLLYATYCYVPCTLWALY